MSPDHQAYLLAATMQPELKAALAYIAEGHFIDGALDRTQLLQAVCKIVDPDPKDSVNAIRRLAREVATSKLNTAAVLLSTELITPPSVYRKALDVLASKCPTKSLGNGLGHKIVIAAQRDDAYVMTALAAIVGLSGSELIQRANLATPSNPSGTWPPDSIRLAFEVVDDIVCNRVAPPLTNGLPSRPIELLGDPKVTENQKSGWAEIEKFRTMGVPYEVLLAQRVEGGAWRTHRDRTGSKFAVSIAEELCQKLEEAGINVLRTRNCGGQLTSNQVEAMVGGGGDQVALIILDKENTPTGVVAISVANDGGSAAKSGARLATLPPRVNVPTSIMVSGFGWSGRNETAELARIVEGRLYSDSTITEFISAMAK